VADREGVDVSKRKPIEYTCRVVPYVNPATATIFEMAFGMTDPVLSGDGELTLLCGQCGRVIVQSVDVGALTGIFIRCTCRAYNDTTVV
jgi:hypothetical protein